MSAIKRAALRLLTGRGAREAFRPWTAGRVPILMAHRFSTNFDPDGEPGEPALLECARLVERSGFRAMTLGQLCAELAAGRIPPRTFCVTVDDGYRDFYEVAFPVLKRYGIPATVFVSSDLADGAAWYWWDRLDHVFRHAPGQSLLAAGEVYRWRSDAERSSEYHRLVETCKRLDDSVKSNLIRDLESALPQRPPPSPPAEYRVMSWGEIREIQSHGIEIGCHTASHPILSRVSSERADDEIARGAEGIEQETGVRPRTFAYPGGRDEDYTPEVVNLLERHAFAGAVTGEWGVVCRRRLRSNDKPLFRLPRVGMPPTPEGIRQAVCGIEALKQDIGYSSRRPPPAP